MTEPRTPGPEDYFGIRINPGENLADRFPQVAVRARLYRLEDDGASDLAQRKRARKDAGDVVARRKAAIEAIEKRQRGESRLQPLDPVIAAARIESHRRAIRRHEAGLDDLPAVNVLAPVARRVAREDRRRERKASRG